MLIAGDGLVLRPWSDPDLESMCLLFDDPDVARWTPLESPFDAAAARRYLVRAADRARTGEALHLAVTTQGTDPLGEVLLVDRGGGTGELGYVIGAAYRGRRLASRAVRLLGDHAVRVRGMRRLVLRIEAGNAASERVALACGYRPADAPATVTDPGPAVRTATDPGPAGRTVTDPTLRAWERIPPMIGG